MQNQFLMIYLFKMIIVHRLVYCSPKTLIKSMRDSVEVVAFNVPTCGRNGFWLSMSLWFGFDFLAFLTPFTCRSSVVPALLHAAIETFVASASRTKHIVTLKAVCIRTLAKNIHVLQVFDSISGPETSIPGCQKDWAKNPQPVGFLNHHPDGRCYGKKTLHLGCKCFLFGQVSLNIPTICQLHSNYIQLYPNYIPSVENSVSMLKPNCCGEQVQANSVKNSLPKKNKNLRGPCDRNTIQIPRYGDNHSYPKI